MVRCVHASTQIFRYVRQRTEPLAAEGNTETVMFREKAIVQNVSVLTDMRSVDYINGFLDQIKRGIK